MFSRQLYRGPWVVLARDNEIGIGKAEVRDIRNVGWGLLAETTNSWRCCCSCCWVQRRDPSDRHHLWARIHSQQSFAREHHRESGRPQENEGGSQTSEADAVAAAARRVRIHLRWPWESAAWPLRARVLVGFVWQYLVWMSWPLPSPRPLPGRPGSGAGPATVHHYHYPLLPALVRRCASTALPSP